MANDICDLEASQAAEITAIAIEHYEARISPQDCQIYQRDDFRRRLARRYTPRLVATTDGLGVMASGRLAAFAFYGQAINELTGEREMHLLDLVARPGSRGALPELVVRLREEAERDACDLLCATLPAGNDAALEDLAVAAAAGFELHQVYVRKVVVAPSVGNHGYVFTSEATRAFALDCLVGGLLNGHRAFGHDLPRAAVEAYADKHFSKLNSARRVSLIAVDGDGTPRAHALAEISQSELRAAKEAALVDSFVPPDWKGEGWGGRVWTYMESVLAQRGIDRCEGTVGFLNSAAGPRVMSALARDGWWADRHALVMGITRSLSTAAPVPATAAAAG